MQDQIEKYGQEYDAEGIEALEMAIKALEQESITWIVGKDNCQVAVRNMPIDKMQKICAIIGEEEQQPCEDCVSREAALEAVEEQKKGFYGVERYAIDECYSAIMKLPSVKPQRPKGKWINNTYNHHCSECGYGLTNETYMFYGLNRENDERHDCYCGWEDNLMNYCPCCGAEMEDSND